MSGNELNYKNNRSGIMVNGVGRSGNRALLYSMGLEEDDFRKPIIGIANSFSELVPGHIHLRDLARDVRSRPSSSPAAPCWPATAMATPTSA